MNAVLEKYFPDRASLRNWLKQNYDKEKSIWLVFDKASKGGKLSYDDIVEEALCFGWIDSTAGKHSEGKTKIYLSQRKPNSVWAISNKERVEKLISSGLMQEPGLNAVQVAKENGSWNALNDVDNMKIPEELSQALKKNKKAAKFFETLSVSMRKQILYNIYSAKQTETREKRAEKIVSILEENKKPF